MAQSVPPPTAGAWGEKSAPPGCAAGPSVAAQQGGLIRSAVLKYILDACSPSAKAVLQTRPRYVPVAAPEAEETDKRSNLIIIIVIFHVSDLHLVMEFIFPIVGFFQTDLFWGT